MRKIICFLKEEKGQGMTEYALILCLVAVAAAVAFAAFGVAVKDNLYNSINKIEEL